MTKSHRPMRKPKMVLERRTELEKSEPGMQMYGKNRAVVVQILYTQINTNIVPVPFLSREVSLQRGKAFPNPAAGLRSLGGGS